MSKAQKDFDYVEGEQAIRQEMCKSGRAFVEGEQALERGLVRTWMGEQKVNSLYSMRTSTGINFLTKKKKRTSTCLEEPTCRR